MMNLLLKVAMNLVLSGKNLSNHSVYLIPFLRSWILVIVLDLKLKIGIHTHYLVILLFLQVCSFSCVIIQNFVNIYN